MRSAFRALAVLLFLCFAFAAESSSFASRPIFGEGWAGDNAAALSRMIRDYGKSSKSFDPARSPVAAFDWDNTVIKNDVGDALMYWMLRNDKILQPPRRGWSRTSPLLTDAAVSSLKRACDGLARPGSPLATGGDDEGGVACADEILSIYGSGKAAGGAKAWRDGSLGETMEPAYAWAVSLQSGYTPEEIKGFAEKAIEFNLANPLGAVQRVGSSGSMSAYMRVYDEISRLISGLREAGFDVWVISASSQPAVEAFASRVGIPADRVVGVRAVRDSSGKLTASFEGCGPYAKGNFGIITFKKGKRCWLNKVAFGVLGPEAQMDLNSPLLFAAGDSDTDIVFMKDARYRLAIDRGKPELMCNALHGASNRDNGQGVWMVNHMFIGPKAPRNEPYDCSPFGIPDQPGM